MRDTPQALPAGVRHITILVGTTIMKPTGGKTHYTPGRALVDDATAEALIADGKAEPHPKPEPLPGDSMPLPAGDEPLAEAFIASRAHDASVEE